MMAGPAYKAAAEPVSTKIPAPIMAPMPRVTRLIGPSARFSEFSPVSPASFINTSSDLVAKSGLPMQLLLFLPKNRKARALLFAGSTFALCAGPQPVHRKPQQHNHHAHASCLRFIQQKHTHDSAGGQYIQQWKKRVSESLVGALQFWATGPQDKNSHDGQHIEQKRGEYYIVQEIAIKVSVSSIRFARTQQ